jgi:hypothetical protein
VSAGDTTATFVGDAMVRRCGFRPRAALIVHSRATQAGDVLLWLANPSTNFGWLVVGDERTAGTLLVGGRPAARRAANRVSQSFSRARDTVFYSRPTLQLQPLGSVVPTSVPTQLPTAMPTEQAVPADKQNLDNFAGTTTARVVIPLICAALLLAVLALFVYRRRQRREEQRKIDAQRQSLELPGFLQLPAAIAAADTVIGTTTVSTAETDEGGHAEGTIAALAVTGAADARDESFYMGGATGGEFSMQDALNALEFDADVPFGASTENFFSVAVAGPTAASTAWRQQ